MYVLSYALITHDSIREIRVGVQLSSHTVLHSKGPGSVQKCTGIGFGVFVKLGGYTIEGHPFDAVVFGSYNAQLEVCKGMGRKIVHNHSSIPVVDESKPRIGPSDCNPGRRKGLLPDNRGDTICRRRAAYIVTAELFR